MVRFATDPLDEEATAERIAPRRRRRPTWAQLVRQEPLLAGLEVSIRQVKPEGRYFCANRCWYGFGSWQGRGFKARLERLVGWGARNPALRTSDAYDAAYQHLYNLLPDCRQCACA